MISNHFFPAPTVLPPGRTASTSHSIASLSARVLTLPDTTHPSAPITVAHTVEDAPSTHELLTGARATRASALSEADWAEAERLAEICRQYLDLRKTYSLNQAARALDKSPSWFSGENSPLARYQRGGVAALLPRRGEAGAKPQIEVPDWFIPAAKFYYLLTNRNRTSGSVPEAIRRTISLPATPPHWDAATKRRLLAAIQSSIPSLTELPSCPPALRELIITRERAGQRMLPTSITRQISTNPATVHQYRSPKNAALDYLNSPGSLMWITEADGTKRFIRAGDILEADDGSVNFPCCVPWTVGGCPVSEKFGVKVGRFQFLRAIDAATRFRPGYVYVMRPSGSYRQEDILSLIAGVTRAHGKWRRFRFEKGSWKGNRVKEVARLMGTQLDTVYSPHSKAFVEGGFNQDWTKLSPFFPGCDIGRFMGETEAANKLLTRCQSGAEDPRKHFPMLADVLAAFRQITDEENATPVNSPNYGLWVPEDRWNAQRAQQPMTPLDPETSWMFAPWVREWTVKGMLVGGKVRLFEELSVPFDFSAEFLPQFHGAKVRAYFDPFDPQCHATIVLASNHGRHRAGEVLGQARQINEVAGYARLVMGWADDPATSARHARQQAAAAMRREVRAIIPHATRHTPHVTGTSEIRDGIATTVTADLQSTDSAPHAAASRECESLGGPKTTATCASARNAFPGENHGAGILLELAAREAAASKHLADNPLDFV